MLKKTVALGLTLCALTASAYAEQPKVQEYRNILQSGKYYIEYEFDGVNKILAVEDHRRMDYTVLDKKVGIGFIKFKVEFKDPTVLYQYGKFYQFTSRKNAKMATWDQLNDPNLDPLEAWSTVKQRLALPDELAILAPNEEYNQNLTGQENIVLEESGEAIVNGKPQIFDKYRAKIKNKRGKVIAEKIYFFYYKDGELDTVKSFVQTSGDIERPIRTLSLKKISAELPENILKIPDGCKVYAAGIGDMDDLLDQPKLLEDYTVKKEAGKNDGE